MSIVMDRFLNRHMSVFLHQHHDNTVCMFIFTYPDFDCMIHVIGSDKMRLSRSGLWYVVTEVTIFITFLLCIFLKTYERPFFHVIQYSAIGINTLFCINSYMKSRKQSKADRFFLSAILMTAIADFLLVILSSEVTSLLGFLTFFLVQLAYGCTLNNIITLIRVRIVINLILLAIFVPVTGNWIYSIGFSVYLTQLILNICATIRDQSSFNSMRQYHLALFGFILFLLCDIFVILRFIIPVRPFEVPITDLVAWIFYIPSQVCLALTYLLRKDRTL